MTASAPDTEWHVVLSLRPSGPDHQCQERRITLNRDKDNITIGRASKVSTKGFVAASDNAWFDSAVMSRLHARIHARMDQKRLEIQDMGSLHGTYLNGDHRVPTDNFRDLQDGDTLRFGVPIWRGTQQFLPTTVRVGVTFSDRERPENLRPTTFQVPDGSDDEGSVGASSGGDYAKPNGHGLGRPYPPTGDQAACVIDLTGGQNSQRTQHIIDLSSSCSSRIAPIHIEDEDDESTSLLGREEGAEPESVSDVGPCSRETHLQETGGRDILHADPDAGETSPESYMDEDDQDVTDVLVTDSDEEGGSDDYSDDESDSELGGYEDESMLEGESDDSDSDDDSLDDEFDHDPRDGYRGDALRAQYPEIDRLLESISHHVWQVSPCRTGETAPSSSSNGLSISGLLNGDGSQYTVTGPEPQPRQDTQDLPVTEPHPEDSSPSKAFYTAQSYSPAAQALGSRSGKMDYFLAREQNRMMLETQKTENARPPSSVHALCNADEFEVEPSSYRFGPAATELSSDVSREGMSLACNPELVEPSSTAFCSSTVPLTPETDADRGDPDVAPDATAPLMTSLESSEGAAKPGPRRAHLDIRDIVNDYSQQSPLNAKRKADEISGTTHEEEVWAMESCGEAADLASSPTLASDGPVRYSPVRASSPAVPEAEQTSQESEIASAVAVSEPPLKRARMLRVAERLGYAALGGVTAGAMIMGTLIYTAPTFG